jgi:hypothetical protein
MMTTESIVRKLGLTKAEHFIHLNIFPPGIAPDSDCLISSELRCRNGCCSRPAEGYMFGIQICEACISDKIERGF